MSSTTAVVSTSDWIKGISLSILASVIGGASKLAIRKSWLMEKEDCPDAVSDDSSRLHHDYFCSDGCDTTEPQRISVERDQAPSRSDSSHVELPSGDSNSGGGGTGDVEPRRDSPTGDSVDEDSEDEHTTVPDRERSLVSREVKRPNWGALCLRGSGMVGMTFLNPACCVLAMNYASPSILAPFSGLTLVWIVLFSQPLVGERPSRNQVIAASLIVLGEVVVAIFGDHTNDEGVTVQDVAQSYLYPPFLLYFGALTGWMLLLVYWMKDSSVNEMLRRFAWGVSGGSVTGLQNFLKDSLTILKANKAEASISSSTTFPWYFPLFLLFAAGSAFGGLLFLTACMKRYDATYSAAMFVGSFVVSASIMSAAHYATFAHLENIWNWILYPAGLVILMGGVWMLVHETSYEEQQEPTRPRRQAGPVEMEPLVSEDEEGDATIE